MTDTELSWSKFIQSSVEQNTGIVHSSAIGELTAEMGK